MPRCSVPDLGGLVALSALVVWAGVRERGMVPLAAEGDFACHLMHSAAYHRLLQSDLPLGSLAQIALTFIGRYPPVPYAWSGAVYVFAGASEDTAILSQVMLLVPIIFATFFTALRLSSRPLAWAAALLVASSPTLLHNAQQYLLDLTMAAMVAIAMYFVYACDRFQRGAASVALGAAMGLGMMSKYSFAFFLIPPWLALLLAASWEQWRERGPAGVIAHWLLALNFCIFAVALGQKAFTVGPDPSSGDPLAFLLPPGLASLLVKAAAACLLWIPAAWVVARAFPGRAMLHAQWCFAVWLLVMSPWYLSNLGTLREIWLPAATVNPYDVVNDRGMHWAHLAEVQSAIWAVPIAIGLVAWLYPALRRGFLVALSFACGLYFMYFHLPPATRYVAPFGPLAALLAVYWIPRRRATQVLAVVLAAITAAVILTSRAAGPSLRTATWTHPAAPVLRAFGAFRLVGEAFKSVEPSLVVHARAAQASDGPVSAAVISVVPFSYEGVVPLWLNLEGRAMMDGTRIAYAPVFLEEGRAQVIRLYDVCWAIHRATAAQGVDVPLFEAPKRGWNPTLVVVTWRSHEERATIMGRVEAFFGSSMELLDIVEGGLETVEVYSVLEGR